MDPDPESDLRGDHEPSFRTVPNPHHRDQPPDMIPDPGEFDSDVEKGLRPTQ